MKSCFSTLHHLRTPPHPTWQSKVSKRRVHQFLSDEYSRSPNGPRLNLGAGSKRYDIHTFNLDLSPDADVDIQGDLLSLPIKNDVIETIVCTGVLEHVHDASGASKEIYRVLKHGGRVFLETPFMQTVHMSPGDYYRWTPDAIRLLLHDFHVIEINVVAGPASALAWMMQETLSMLFSLRSTLLYKVGLRVFGWLSIPISWFDMILEHHPMAWRAASGYSITAVKQ
jgi:SAM-dependent methyltransferase